MLCRSEAARKWSDWLYQKGELGRLKCSRAHNYYVPYESGHSVRWSGKAAKKGVSAHANRTHWRWASPGLHQSCQGTLTWAQGIALQGADVPWHSNSAGCNVKSQQDLCQILVKWGEEVAWSENKAHCEGLNGAIQAVSGSFWKLSGLQVCRRAPFDWLLALTSDNLDSLIISLPAWLLSLRTQTTHALSHNCKLCRLCQTCQAAVPRPSQKKCSLLGTIAHCKLCFSRRKDAYIQWQHDTVSIGCDCLLLVYINLSTERPETTALLESASYLMKPNILILDSRPRRYGTA